MSAHPSTPNASASLFTSPAGAEKQPVAVWTDPKRNLLHVRFAGHVRAADMTAGAGTVERLLSTLRPTFTIVTDLSDLDAMDLDCVTHLTRIMDLCRSAGLSVAARIIPDPNKDIGFNILAHTHYRGAVQVLTFDSRADAERALNAP